MYLPPTCLDAIRKCFDVAAVEVRKSSSLDGLESGANISSKSFQASIAFVQKTQTFAKRRRGVEFGDSTQHARAGAPQHNCEVISARRLSAWVGDRGS